MERAGDGADPRPSGRHWIQPLWLSYGRAGDGAERARLRTRLGARGATQAGIAADAG
jgi:hypothetical protein